MTTAIIILKLIGALIIDAIGIGINVLGFITGLAFFTTLSDTIWAPISAVLIKLMFNNNVMAIVGFLEEITFLDFIPSATIAWGIEVFS